MESEAIDPDREYTVHEVAKFFEVEVSTVRGWLSRKQIKPCRKSVDHNKQSINLYAGTELIRLARKKYGAK